VLACSATSVINHVAGWLLLFVVVGGVGYVWYRIMVED
jgi:hypothetical protein